MMRVHVVANREDAKATRRCGAGSVLATRWSSAACPAAIDGEQSESVAQIGLCVLRRPEALSKATRCLSWWRCSRRSSRVRN